MRLRQKYYTLNAADDALANPLRRDESLLLTASGTMKTILTCIQQRDIRRLYRYLAQSDPDTGEARMEYEAFASKWTEYPALTAFDFSGGSSSSTRAVFTVSGTRLADGVSQKFTGRSVHLMKTGGLWWHQHEPADRNCGGNAMKKSKFRLMALMMALLLTLTSCSRESSLAPAETLPPPSAPYAAPTDDTGLDYERDVALYLPAKNGQTMLCFWRTAALRYDQMPAEAVLQLLLQEEGDGRAVPLKAYGNVSLAQGSAVTTAGHVCTVNLSSAALQMGIHELYMVCLSIATTLCALPDVRFVNILVAGNPVAMDVQNLLPLGALSSAEGRTSSPAGSSSSRSARARAALRRRPR